MEAATRSPIMRSARGNRTTPPTNDEFASVLHNNATAAAAVPATALEAGADHADAQLPTSARAKSDLTDHQLYDRIEEQLEQLDKKRLTLQQLLRSWRETPYSSRLARSVESTRVDSARLAKRIHNLFKFVRADAASAPDVAAAAEPTINRFQPLFHNYAAVSRILNAACMESVTFEEELAQKAAAGGGPGSRKGSTADSASSGLSARRRHAAPEVVQRTQPSYDLSSEMNNISLDGSTAHDEHGPVQTLVHESLPQLQVHGLESYEAQKQAGDYMNLQSMVLDVAKSFHTLQTLAAQQQELLNHSESNVSLALEKSKLAELELRKASRYKAYGLVLAGGVTGAAIAGPLGVLVGLKTGLSIGVGIGLCGVGGALVGAAAGKQIQRARFVPLNHMEEENELASLAEREREIQEKERLITESSSASQSSTTQPEDKRNCVTRRCL